MATIQAAAWAMGPSDLVVVLRAGLLGFGPQMAQIGRDGRDGCGGLALRALPLPYRHGRAKSRPPMITLSV